MNTAISTTHSKTSDLFEGSKSSIQISEYEAQIPVASLFVYSQRPMSSIPNAVNRIGLKIA